MSRPNLGAGATVRGGLVPRLVVALVAVVTLSIALSSYLAVRAHRIQLQRAFVSRGEAIALGLAFSVARQGGPDGAPQTAPQVSSPQVKKLLQEMTRLDGVAYILIQDWEGSIVVHTFGDFPEEFDDRNFIKPGQLRPEQRTQTLANVRVTLRERAIVVTDVAAPISGALAGVVHVGMDQQPVDEAAARLEREMWLAGGGVMLLGAFGAALALFALLARPIRGLAGVAEHAALGGETTFSAYTGRHDELGLLARALDHAFSQLGARTRELGDALGAARAASEAKGRFLATMSHEIRTPMNGVFGMTELLLRTALDDKQRRYMTSIQGSANALLVLLNDVLDYSKIEAGKLAFERIELEPEALVEDVVELAAPRAHAKDLEIASALAPDVPTRILGDPGRLRQILTNLVGNAVKFTERGEVTVRVRCLETTRLRFEVCDTGPGIDAEDQPRLFQHFTQGETSISRRYGGSGLGLAISRQLVELMGGTIGVKSERGRGSLFWFELPLDAIATREPPTAGPRVLLVAPLLQTTDLLATRLETLGAAIERADDDAAALGRLSCARWDAVVFVPDLRDSAETMLADARRLGAAAGSARLVLAAPIGLEPAVSAGLEGQTLCIARPVRQVALAAAICGQRAAPVGRRQAPSEAAPVAPGAPLVLVVDDNDVNRLVAREMLTALGLRVDEASDGVLALERHEQGGLSAMLVDGEMPRLDGCAMTRALREREGDGPHLAVVGVSAYAMAEDRARALAAGMDDYLTKPISIEALSRTLLRLGIVGAAPPVPAAPGPADATAPAVTSGLVLRPKVVSLFLRVMPERMNELGALCRAGDAAELRARAHAFRGACLQMGAKPLAELAGRLEHLGATDDPAELVLALARELDRVCAFLRALPG